MNNTPRKRLLGGAGAFLALGLVAACGSSGPGDTEGLEVWTLEDAPFNVVLEESIETYEDAGDTSVEMVTYVNDSYKQRLQVALGSPNAPDIFFNWGGGNLSEYVTEGQIHDLTGALEDNPEVRDAFLPSVLDVAEIDGSYYGMPMLGVQPVVLFYNRTVLEDAGLEPPETYDDLLNAVDVLQEDDTTPIVLPGAQGWTQLMWFSYLVDRLGGPEPFEAIVNGEEGAWHDPAVIGAMEMCQDLVDRGAFGTNFSSIDYDNGSASALLATGDSAFFLMGTWEISNQQEDHAEFLENGELGYTSFPVVSDGDGDPSAIVGNPSNYFSVNDAADDKDAAVDFLMETLTSDQYVDGLIDAGSVPPVEGVEDQLEDTEHADFAVYTHELVSEASTFTQSWDQAISPDSAETMLTNLELLFLGDVTPEEFADNMDGRV